MKASLNTYKKEKDFLVCIDSDGSAIDTMTEKHKRCFGPQTVETWNLYNIEKEFLKTWNWVNLYSNTRGINRFKGLIRTFEVLADKGFDVPDIIGLKDWTKNASELSNDSLLKEIEIKEESRDLCLALQWSQEVNERISKLGKADKKVFAEVKNTLEHISIKADVVVVSSANYEALLDEWHYYGLFSYVKEILGQESGSKAYNISRLKKIGYKENHILMIGDAPGDIAAARSNDVMFYPIIPQKENQSWSRLNEKYLLLFFELNYQGEYQNKLIEEFELYLNEESEDIGW